MKKICLLKNDFIHVGGAENVAIKLANELSSQYEVHLVSLWGRKDYPFKDLSSKVVCHYMRESKLSSSKLTFQDIQYFRKYFKENDISLVMSIGFSSNLLMLGATLGTKIKRVFCEHVNQRVNFGKKIFLNRGLSIWLSHKTVALTKEDKGYMIQDYRAKADKIAVIPNWVDGEAVAENYDERSQRIITVGRICHQKGYDLLLKVAEYVLKEEPGWVWDIYGGGDDKKLAELKKEADERGIGDKLIFHGNVLGEENIYPGHSMYVMTSLFEGHPLVLLEASRYRLPLIAFRVPTGIDEVIEDGLNGEVIENLDVKEMGKRIVHLIHYPKKRVSYANQSWYSIDKFDKKKILDLWWKLLEELIG